MFDPSFTTTNEKSLNERFERTHPWTTTFSPIGSFKIALMGVNLGGMYVV